MSAEETESEVAEYLTVKTIEKEKGKNTNSTNDMTYSYTQTHA